MNADAIPANWGGSIVAFGLWQKARLAELECADPIYRSLDDAETPLKAR